MTLNGFRLHSLKTRIILGTSVIFVASLWSLSYYTSQMLRKDMVDLLGAQQFSTASMVSRQINRDLERRVEALESVAKLASGPMQAGPRATQTFLEQRPDLRLLFTGGIFTVGSDGTRTAYDPFAVYRFGINLKHRDYISGPLLEGKATIGKPIIGTTERAPVVVMGAPVRDDRGNVIGALAGSTILSASTFVDQIIENRYGRTGGYFLIAPQYKLFVSATDKRLAMQALPAPGIDPVHDRYMDGYEGYGVTVNSDGVEVLTAAKSIPVTGWFLVIAQPTAEAFAPIRNVQQRMLIATLLLTLLAGGLTWWMLKRQLAPLLVTARNLAAVSDGSQPLRPLNIVRQDEIGQLLSGFNRLLQILGDREALLKQVLDASTVAIFLVDMQGRITQANRRMAEMFGMTIDTLVGSEYVNIVCLSEQDAARRGIQRLLTRTVTTIDLDRRYRRADQSEFWGHMSGQRFYDASGQECGLIGVIADISVRKQAEQSVLKSKRQYDAMAENIPVGIYILRSKPDGAFAMDYVSPPMARMFDLDVDRLLADITLGFRAIHPDDLDGFVTAIHDAIQYRSPFDWTGRVLGNGKLRWLHISSPPELQEDGDVLWHGLVEDITERKEHEKQLEHIAHFDVLTTLPNRVLLADRLHQAMSQGHRRGQLLAVAYLDLDGFKSINDSYGHETGDQLLIALASRMKQTLREGDTLARLGGDEFVAVLLDLVDVSASLPMLSRLLQAAAQPVAVGDLVLQVSASLGVTFYPQSDDVDADQLLRQSDQAMYQAKLAGKNRYHVFDADQDRSVRGLHESLERIRRALAEQEFVLYYQPKVNMRTGAVIGAEALIRWQHPDKGLLPPSVFLPVIENHALAIDIGEWVIDAALAQMEAWRAAGLDIPVSVNIGARQLQRPDFALRLKSRLEAHPGVRPSDLSLEILETSALEDVDRASHAIESCREIGVMFALDDFGTGYSSLTYLKRLPVSLLKIDQSFVRDMLDDPDDLTILDGVISLAKSFRREIIAEGVETVEHGEMLLQLGCEQAQGYGIARPMPAADLAVWMVAWSPDSAWRNLTPLDSEDFPLLFAGVEHRAWVVALEHHLRGERIAPLPLDLHQCGFGVWLDSVGQARYGAQPAFQPVEHLHQEVHALAIEFCELRLQGRNSEALGRLGELHVLRDAVLAQLRVLLRAR